jgi:hypothetical protein
MTATLDRLPAPMWLVFSFLVSADLRLPVPTRQTGVGRQRREDGPGGAGPSRRRNIIWRVAFHAAGNLRRVDSAARRAAFQASEPRLEGGLSIRRLSRTSSASQPVRSFGEFQIQWITAPWIIRQHPWISQQSLGSGGIQVNVIADCHQRPFLRSASIRRRN